MTDDTKKSARQIEAEVAEVCSDTERPKRGKMPPRSLIERAVEAARVYYGSVNRCRYHDEQKLYARLNKLTQQIVDKSQGGLEFWNAERQLRDEAKKRGVRLAMPGMDI